MEKLLAFLNKWAVPLLLFVLVLWVVVSTIQFSFLSNEIVDDVNEIAHQVFTEVAMEYADKNWGN